jgi:two-component sensor histidine kinase
MSNSCQPAGLDQVDATITGTAEAGRLAALKRYDILDTAPEAAFDHITALAADLFGAPISIIAFLDGSRIWFKSHHGLDVTELKRGRDGPSSAIELRLRRELNPAFFACAPLSTSDGHDLGTLCVIDRRARRIEQAEIRRLEALAKIVVDLLELRLARNSASARAALMAAEIDHRAMNSLQFVASLLSLQSRTARPEASAQLMAAANRVLAVARVHRNFADGATAGHIPVLAYLRRLCDELSNILAASVTVEGSEADVPTARLQAVGLIVNELVTNAKKHGGGAIRITFNPLADGRHELCVLDEGPGLPEDFATNAPDRAGLGMKVIGALVGQLNGALSTRANPAGKGACFAVAFPAT